MARVCEEEFLFSAGEKSVFKSENGREVNNSNVRHAGQLLTIAENMAGLLGHEELGLCPAWSETIIIIVASTGAHAC